MLRNLVVLDQDCAAISRKLCDEGFVKISGLLSPNILAKIQGTIEEAFHAAPYGRDEASNLPEPPNRLVGLGEHIDILPIYCLPNDEVKLIPSHPAIKAVLKDLLGEDFYLDRAIVRRARGKCPRFYYHKDQRGDIGLTILMNDLRPEAGATTVRPGTHLGTPPTLFCMRDINERDPAEVELTGNAGDAYFFYRDIDHSRAPNASGADNIQLIMSFVNKNTAPSAHSRHAHTESDLAGVPDDVKHMLRPYDGRPADEPEGLINKLVFGSGFSSAGAGDYDVRNDLFRDFLYHLFLVRGKPVRDKGNGALWRNTTRLNELRNVSLWQYLSHLRWRALLRSLTLQALRRTAIGRAIVSYLRRALKPV
jgi:hypothetical protein